MSNKHRYIDSVISLTLLMRDLEYLTHEQVKRISDILYEKKVEVKQSFNEVRKMSDYNKALGLMLEDCSDWDSESKALEEAFDRGIDFQKNR